MVALALQKVATPDAILGDVSDVGTVAVPAAVTDGAPYLRVVDDGVHAAVFDAVRDVGFECVPVAVLDVVPDAKPDDVPEAAANVVLVADPDAVTDARGE